MTLPFKVPYAKYVAIPTRNGQHWDVRIEDHDWRHRGDTTASRLDQVRPNTCVLLGLMLIGDPSYTFSVQIEPCLPELVTKALDRAVANPAEASIEIKIAVAALRRMNLCRHDIALLLTDRGLPDPRGRPLLLPNVDVAAGGLHRWPDVTGLERPAGDTVLTCCRRCVDGDALARNEVPAGTSAALYDEDVSCDLCGSPSVA